MLGKGKFFAVNKSVKSVYFAEKMISGRNTGLIKNEAVRLGFMQCGISKAERLNEDADRLEKWLKQGFHGSMQYMENHFEKRVDPRLLVDGARSVITLLMNYYPDQVQEQGVPLVSKYAYGEDYHFVIRKKLHELLDFIREEIGAVNGRGFVDSAPVLERSWAVRSGLGWIGKNGNLIHRQSGSFFFIATLIVDLELDYDTPHVKDYCGTCNRCVEACPTEAILPDKTIRGDQCISYFTIELKSLDFNTDLKWNDWMFGCDICQDVCPWNRFAKAQDEEVFHPKKELFNFQFEDWEKMDKSKFQQVFKDSPLKRSGFERIQRNLRFLKTRHQK